MSAANARSPAWLVAAASAIGTSHEARGEGCQDAYWWRTTDTGRLVACVSDGAGSAPHSAEGARMAAETAGQAILSQDVWDDPRALAADGVSAMLEAFRAARSAVEIGRMGEAPLRHYACTLTCVVAGGGRLVTGQIGDGIVVARRDDGTLFSATRPQRGEYANEANFLTAGHWSAVTEVRTWSAEVDGVVLSTDGLLRLAVSVPEYIPHEPFFEPLLRFVVGRSSPGAADRELRRFLGSDRVNARTDDDKTLVVGVRVAHDSSSAAP